MASVPDTRITVGSVEPMVPLALPIERVQKETHDTFTLEFVSPPEFSFAPGQFNMLYVFGVGEVPISISSDPAQKSSFQHTTRAVGTVTSALRHLKKGDTIGIRGPFGSSWPLAEAVGKDCLIVAGGIGLAPLRPVIYSILAQRQRFRRVVILYGARTREDLLYPRQLEHWRGKFDLDIYVTIDRGGPDWRGNVGVVTTPIARLPLDPANTIAMVCGPEVMMRFCLLELQRRDIPLQHVYVSMERNMKCAVGFCGHCQYGPMFVCKDGPVFRFDRIASIFAKPEI